VTGRRDLEVVVVPAELTEAGIGSFDLTEATRWLAMWKRGEHQALCSALEITDSDALSARRWRWLRCSPNSFWRQCENLHTSRIVSSSFLKLRSAHFYFVRVYAVDSHIWQRV
jgi:hypothetical protein